MWQMTLVDSAENMKVLRRGSLAICLVVWAQQFSAPDMHKLIHTHTHTQTYIYFERECVKSSWRRRDMLAARRSLNF